MTASVRKGAPHLPLSWARHTRVVAIATVTFFVATFAISIPSAAQTSAPPKTGAIAALSVPPAPLPVDVAFPVTAAFDKTLRGNIMLKIDVQPGHYLYRDRFEIERDGEGVYSIDKFKQRADAEAKTKNDPHFGRVKVFETPVTLWVGHTARAKSKLTVIYQGCSELAGVCYPPTKRTFDVSGIGVEVAANEAVKPGLGNLLKKQVSQ
ncbi:MAG: protein-disulfide reductase DsbD N-terminal domain-containing protein [Casimicrobium sp.]